MPPNVCIFSGLDKIQSSLNQCPLTQPGPTTAIAPSMATVIAKTVIAKTAAAKTVATTVTTATATFSLLAIALFPMAPMAAIACPPAAQATTQATWRQPQLHRTLTWPRDAQLMDWDVRMALSPDGETLVVGDRTTLRVWQVESEEPLHTFTSFQPAPDAQLGAIAFSPNGRWVAATLYDPNAGVLQLGVWEVATGEVVMRTDRSLPARPDPHASGQAVSLPNWSSVIFSPDSQRLATVAGGNPQVDIWEVATGEVVQSLQGGMGRAIAFSQDGRQLARANTSVYATPPQQSIVLWDLAEPITSRLLLVNYEVLDLVFTPDDQGLYMVLRDPQNNGQYVRRWDFGTATASANLFAFHWSSALTFSADGTTAIAGSPNSPMEVADLQSGQTLAQVDHYFNWGPPTAFSATARTFAVADPGNQRIQIWRPGF